MYGLERMNIILVNENRKKDLVIKATLDTGKEI